MTFNRWYVHTREYHSDIKMNEPLVHSTTCMDLRVITMSGKSQPQKTKFCRWRTDQWLPGVIDGGGVLVDEIIRVSSTRDSLYGVRIGLYLDCGGCTNLYT